MILFIAKSLTISVSNKNFNEIQQVLQTQEVDWDLLVKISTSQLVLPALYCNYKRKNLLQFILNEMHEINESNRTKGKVKMKYLPIHSIQKNLPEKHKISALFWVDFNPNTKAQLKPLTSFNISSSLIPDTWVNPELNYSELFTNWLIQSKGYRLIYSDFSSLVNVLDEQL